MMGAWCWKKSAVVRQVTVFFKTCERHDDLKTLSEMKAYLALRKSLLKLAAEAQERFNKGSPERYNKRARLREMTKAHEEPPKTGEITTENQPGEPQK